MHSEQAHKPVTYPPLTPPRRAGLLSSKKTSLPDRVSFPVRVVCALLTALTGRETLSGRRELNSPAPRRGSFICADAHIPLLGGVRGG